jgi:hypothetical protein
MSDILWAVVGLAIVAAIGIAAWWMARQNRLHSVDGFAQGFDGGPGLPQKSASPDRPLTDQVLFQQNIASGGPRIGNSGGGDSAS